MRLILSNVLAILALLTPPLRGQDNRTPLTAVFNDQVAFAFRTAVHPGGTPVGWPGAILTSGTASEWTAHRVVVDRAGGSHLIYKIQVEPASNEGEFLLSIMPPDQEAIQRYGSRSEPSRRLSLPYYPAPQTIRLGDVVMLDILEDRSRKVTIVDTLSVFDPDRAPGFRSPEALPRDFTLADVELSMVNHQLRIDGREVENGGGVSGAVIWFYAPGYGRFLFSITEQPGYGFEPQGTIRDNRLTFNSGGTQFEWISKRPILKTGAWNLWVRVDRGYQPPPLFGAEPGTGVLVGAADHIGHLVKPVR